MLLCAAGNTEIPAYLVLSEKGYAVSCSKQTSRSWYAQKDHMRFQADSLLEVLGLVCMYESRGINWAATDREIDDFLTEHGG